MSIEYKLAAYAGEEYAKPRRVHAGRIDLYDFEVHGIDALIEALTAFRAEHAGCDIEADFGHWDEARAAFDAYRLETPEEVEARVEGYRAAVRQREEERRKQYERLKREFGDG